MCVPHQCVVQHRLSSAGSESPEKRSSNQPHDGNHGIFWSFAAILNNHVSDEVLVVYVKLVHDA